MHTQSEILPRASWIQLREQELSRVRNWVTEYRDRSARGLKHPVFDFLFTYYSYKSSFLTRWSPGSLTILSDATLDELDWHDYLEESQDGIGIDLSKFPINRLESFNWILTYLKKTAERAPVFACFGLHEWAMIYVDGEIRHEVPLRLTREQISEVLDSMSLRCSHFDAYRFFTPKTRPKNFMILSRESVIDNDQPGCVHATMDLYRCAFKFSPFISSGVLTDAFALACEARVLDMRASPYDLRDFGLDPIKIEEPTGRETYIRLQRELFEKATPLRTRLLAEYQCIARELPKVIAEKATIASAISP